MNVKRPYTLFLLLLALLMIAAFPARAAEEEAVEELPGIPAARLSDPNCRFSVKITRTHTNPAHDPPTKTSTFTISAATLGELQQRIAKLQQEVAQHNEDFQDLEGHDSSIEPGEITVVCKTVKPKIGLLDEGAREIRRKLKELWEPGVYDRVSNLVELYDMLRNPLSPLWGGEGRGPLANNPFEGVGSVVTEYGENLHDATFRLADLENRLENYTNLPDFNQLESVAEFYENLPRTYSGGFSSVMQMYDRSGQLVSPETYVASILKQLEKQAAEFERLYNLSDQQLAQMPPELRAVITSGRQRKTIADGKGDASTGPEGNNPRDAVPSNEAAHKPAMSEPGTSPGQPQVGGGSSAGRGKATVLEGVLGDHEAAFVFGACWIETFVQPARIVVVTPDDPFVKRAIIVVNAHWIEYGVEREAVYVFDQAKLDGTEYSLNFDYFGGVEASEHLAVAVRPSGDGYRACLVKKEPLQNDMDGCPDDAFIFPAPCVELHALEAIYRAPFNGDPTQLIIDCINRMGELAQQ